MKYISVCILFILLFFFITFHSVYALSGDQLPEFSDGQINEALTKTIPIRFLPSHPLYFLISGKEAVSRFFQSSAAKRAGFDFVLSGKRLKETYLLLEKGDLNRASKNLIRYSNRIEATILQLNKARSQNQDVSSQISSAVEGLENHEVLLVAINGKRNKLGGDYGFDHNFETAILGFKKIVDTIENVKPGVRNRYEILDSSLMYKEIPTSTSSPSPSTYDALFEASPSVKPRRIIY